MRPLSKSKVRGVWELVDARSSDALNLAVLTDAPVFVSTEMLADCIGRQEDGSAEGARLQRAIAAGP